MTPSNGNKPKRTLLERETSLLWNDEEEMVLVGTTSPMMCRKLTRRLGTPVELSPGSWSWTIPKDWLKLPAKKRKRTLSPEHREKLQVARKRRSNSFDPANV